MRRVVVSGATGFIGRQALIPLLERGFEVHALHIQGTLDLDPRIVWHRADLLTDQATSLCAAIRPTHLLHFAWYVNPKDYKTSPENDRWRDATLSLVRAFRENGGSRAVCVGTPMEYDLTVIQDVLNEKTSPIAPNTVYGRAKNETRVALENYAAESGLSFAWGRAFNLYGPHEASGRLMPNAITAFLKGEKFTMTAVEHVLDYSYVKDTAGAFATLLDSTVEGVINIGSGIPITLQEIVRTIAEMTDRSELLLLEPNASSPAASTRIVADITRLSREVGWTPKFDLQSGLAETIAWWKEEITAGRGGI